MPRGHSSNVNIDCGSPTVQGIGMSTRRNYPVARSNGRTDNGVPGMPTAAPLAEPEPLVGLDKPAIDPRQYSKQATRTSCASERDAFGSGGIYQRSIRFADDDTDDTYSYYDDDPGVMSEAETSSTIGPSSYVRRRQAENKQTMMMPSQGTSERNGNKIATLPRSLGMTNGMTTSDPGRKSGVVFLQYQGETKRAVLPINSNDRIALLNSLDDVRSLFVKAFPHELPLDYFKSPNVKIYIQDSSKADFFYQLDDLSDIKDRSVLKLHESTRPNSPPPAPTQPKSDIEVLPNHSRPSALDIRGYQRHQSVDDMNYFSEPEFDGKGDYRLQKSLSTSNYTGANAYQRQGARQYGTLDRYYGYRGGIGPPKPARVFGTGNSPGARSSIRNSYSPPRSGDGGYSSSFEQDDSFIRSGYNRDYLPSPTTESAVDALYQQRHGRISRSGSATPVIDEEARVRMMNMEKQLASLSALVHSALMSKGVSETVYKDMEMLRREIFALESAGSSKDDASDTGSVSRFSDLSSDKGSYQSNPDRDVSNSSAPFSPAPLADSSSPSRPVTVQVQPSAIHLTPEARHNLRTAKRKVTEVQGELKNLRRMAQLNAQCSRDVLKDAFDRIKFLLNTNKQLHLFAAQAQHQNALEANSISGDRKWINQEEDRYLVETKRAERGLSSLEKEVEELRQKVINGERKLRMSEVESFTDSLTQIGRSTANLKNNFPNLENRMRNYMTSEMEKVVREEKFLKDEPYRLDNALKRCKKLANTMVTMKKLALVQDPSAYSGNSKRPPLPSKSIASVDSEAKSSPTSPPSHLSPSLDQRRPLSPLKERITSSVLVNGGSSIRFTPQFSPYKDQAPVPHLSSYKKEERTHPLDNLLDELQSAAKHKNGKMNGNGETTLNVEKRVGFADEVKVLRADQLNDSGDSDTIKRSPKMITSHNGHSVNSVLRTNLNVNVPYRSPVLTNASPERRSMSPSPMSASFRAAIPFLHGGKLGAPVVRSGTPNSVSSEPAIYIGDHSAGRVPPPPPRSSSRNAVTGPGDTTPPSFRAEFEKKQRLFSSGGMMEKGTSRPFVHTNAVDEESRYVRSASSSESVNSQDGSQRKRNADNSDVVRNDTQVMMGKQEIFEQRKY